MQADNNAQCHVYIICRSGCARINMSSFAKSDLGCATTVTMHDIIQLSQGTFLGVDISKSERSRKGLEVILVHFLEFPLLMHTHTHGWTNEIL